MQGFAQADKIRRVAQLHLDSLRYRERGPEDFGQGRTCQDRGVWFFQLTVVLSDLSMHQVLLYSQSYGDVESALLVEPTAWVKTTRRARCHATNLVDDSDLIDAFIEPDGLVCAKEPCLKRPNKPPKPIESRALASTRHLLDYTLLYEKLLESSLPSTAENGADEDTVDVSVVVQETERLLLGEMTLAEPLLGTL
jgi:hypothetical protein